MSSISFDFIIFPPSLQWGSWTPRDGRDLMETAIWESFSASCLPVSHCTSSYLLLDEVSRRHVNYKFHFLPESSSNHEKYIWTKLFLRIDRVWHFLKLVTVVSKYSSLHFPHCYLWGPRHLEILNTTADCNDLFHWLLHMFYRWIFSQGWIGNYEAFCAWLMSENEKKSISVVIFWKVFVNMKILYCNIKTWYCYFVCAIIHTCR